MHFTQYPTIGHNPTVIAGIPAGKTEFRLSLRDSRYRIEAGIPAEVDGIPTSRIGIPAIIVGLSPMVGYWVKYIKRYSNIKLIW